MKIITAASAILLGLTVCGAAQAQMRSRPMQSYGYLFAEYDHFRGKGGTGSLNGGGIGGGWRLNRYLGAQLGGQYFRKSGVDITNGYLEGLVHMPFTPRFSLYGSIGGSYARASTSVKVGAITTTVSTSGSGYRAGAGMEYWMTPQVSLRAGFHRQNALGVADDFGVGLGFRF